MSRSSPATRTKCRQCGRRFIPMSATSGFCGGTCAYLHRVGRLEGPVAEERTRRRMVDQTRKEPILELEGD
jgi:hypothetical protein